LRRLVRDAVVSGIRRAFFAIFVLACSQPVAPSPPPAQPVPPPAPPPGAWLDAGPFVDDAPAEPAAQLTVLDPGAAPRAPLRYPEGASVQVERRLHASMRQDTSPEDAPTLSIGSPPFNMAMGMRYERGWRYRLGAFELERGAAFDEVVFRRLFADWKPVEGELAIDARGRRPEGASVFYQHSTDQASELLKLLDDVFDAWTPVFPEESVGVGARWRVIDTVHRGGLTLARTSSFTLVATGRVRAEVQMDVPRPQRAHVLFKDQVLTVALAYWKVDLRSEVTLDPTSLLPRRARADYKLTFLVKPDDDAHAAVRPDTLVLSAELR
jgi:hypothetical protein